MLFELLSMLSSRVLLLALHLENGSAFPKPLSAAKEQECFQKMAAGDTKAHEDLIAHNLRLVAHICKKYYSSTNDQDDLISIGTIGLIKAINTFSYEKKAKFSTYAARCIENEVLMFFRASRKSLSDLSINEPIDSDKDGNALTLMDVVADETSMADLVDLRLRSEQLYRLVQQVLNPRERMIIELRYGLYGRVPLTQRTIANRLKISRSYVSRLESKALNKLKIAFEKG